MRHLSWYACVAEFEGEEFQQSAIDEFTSKYGLPSTNITVVGANSGGYYGEGILDLEYQIGA